MELEETAFLYIAEALSGCANMPDEELPGAVTDAIALHIEDHWVPTLPLTETNRIAVATVTASFMLDLAHWLATDIEAYRTEYNTAMRRLLDLIEAAGLATKTEPVQGVTVGDIHAWYELVEKLRGPSIRPPELKR